MQRIWFGLEWLFTWSHTADVLCIEVNKQSEKVRGGECIDARSEYESERVYACIHSTDFVKKRFLNGSKQNETGMNMPEFVQ